MSPTAIAVTVNAGSRNAAGGTTLMMRSRKMPPPTAVVMARTATPRISIFFLMPTEAPETANAMVPMSSNV